MQWAALLGPISTTFLDDNNNIRDGWFSFVMTWFKTPDHLQELLITSEPQGMYLGNCYGHSDCIFYDLYNS